MFHWDVSVRLRSFVCLWVSVCMYVVSFIFLFQLLASLVFFLAVVWVMLLLIAHIYNVYIQLENRQLNYTPTWKNRLAPALAAKLVYHSSKRYISTQIHSKQIAKRMCDVWKWTATATTTTAIQTRMRSSCARAVLWTSRMRLMLSVLLVDRSVGRCVRMRLNLSFFLPLFMYITHTYIYVSN